MPIENLKQGNYIPLLDSKLYVTGTPRKVSRQRIDDNLLGTLELSPIVRRGEADLSEENEKLKRECQDIISEFPATIYQRAVRYL